jgi:hypothetical protein
MMRSPRSFRWLWLLSTCYLGLVAVVVWSMFAARRSVLTNLATTESIQNWQEWRDDVVLQQQHPQTVQRRVPKSTEPPALVLMRDYFPISLSGALLFATCLYWIMAWFIIGTLVSSHK